MKKMLMRAALRLQQNLKIMQQVQGVRGVTRAGPVFKATVSQMLEHAIAFDIIENPTNASPPRNNLRAQYVVNLTSLVVGGELQENALYMPMDHEFPFVDYFYKMGGKAVS